MIVKSFVYKKKEVAMVENLRWGNKVWLHVLQLHENVLMSVFITFEDFTSPDFENKFQSTRKRHIHCLKLNFLISIGPI